MFIYTILWMYMYIKSDPAIYMYITMVTHHIDSLAQSLLSDLVFEVHALLLEVE